MISHLWYVDKLSFGVNKPVDSSSNLITSLTFEISCIGMLHLTQSKKSDLNGIRPAKAPRFRQEEFHLGYEKCIQGYDENQVCFERDSCNK